MTYEDDFKPLYDIINTVFLDRMENELLSFHKKYKTEFLINNASRLEYDIFIKKYTEIIFSYLSNIYVKKTLLRYYSQNGIAFLILTNLSVKSKLFYSSLSN